MKSLTVKIKVMSGSVRVAERSSVSTEFVTERLIVMGVMTRISTWAVTTPTFTTRPAVGPGDQRKSSTRAVTGSWSVSERRRRNNSGNGRTVPTLPPVVTAEIVNAPVLDAGDV